MEIKDKILEMLTTPMKSAFDGAGLTNEYLARRLKSELNYSEPIEKEIVEGKGKSKTIRKIMKRVKTPAAMQIRQKARESAHRLLSHFPPERKEIGGPGGTPFGAGDARPIKVVFVDPEDEHQKKEGEKIEH